MSTPTMPPVECERHHPSLAVNDVAAAAEFYTQKLGFRLAFTWGTPPTMAGLNLGEVQIFRSAWPPSSTTSRTTSV